MFFKHAIYYIGEINPKNGYVDISTGIAPWFIQITFLLGYPQYLKPSYGGIIGKMLSEIPLAKSLLPLAMDSKTLSSANVEEVIVNLHEAGQ